VAGTTAESATPNPSDTPSPRSSRATSEPSLTGANDAADIDTAGANQPPTAVAASDESTGANTPDAVGANATSSNARRVRVPSAFTNSVEYTFRADTSSADPAASPGAAGGAFASTAGREGRLPATDAGGGGTGGTLPSVGSNVGCTFTGNEGLPSDGTAGTPGPRAPCDTSVDTDGGTFTAPVFCTGGVNVAPAGNTGGAAAAGTGVLATNDATNTSAVTGPTRRHRRDNRPTLAHDVVVQIRPPATLNSALHKIQKPRQRNSPHRKPPGLLCATRETPREPGKPASHLTERDLQETPEQAAHVQLRQ